MKQQIAVWRFLKESGVINDTKPFISYPNSSGKCKIFIKILSLWIILYRFFYDASLTICVTVIKKMQKVVYLAVQITINAESLQKIQQK